MLGHDPTWRDTLRHFCSFAETLLDKLLAASGRYDVDRLRIEGRELMSRAIAEGRGGVIVTAHMGCLELCQIMAERVGKARLTVLVHTAHAERFNAILTRLNPEGGVRLLQVTEVSIATATLLAERVAQGEFVAIAGDRVPVSHSKTTTASFLGHSAPFPVGAYVIAALLRCPLFFMGCVRERQGHLVRFELLDEQVTLPRKQRDAACAALAGRFASRVEAMLAQAPLDWFNFFPFWDQAAGAPLPAQAHHD
ncbi:acyltransferase [Schlegelella sp. S2-27]|uniref:Acyltransferase n=1 Tax=Caldimonas mangrovi TaxID=2944811 RepID=A0ABT0YVS2_9BURK|nr:acyltransferase [Caldimonas mangrovi]